ADYAGARAGARPAAPFGRRDHRCGHQDLASAFPDAGPARVRGRGPGPGAVGPGAGVGRCGRHRVQRRRRRREPVRRHARPARLAGRHVHRPGALRPGLPHRQRRAYRLVRGRWWPTFGALLVAFMFQFFLGLVLGIPLALLTASWDSGSTAAIALTSVVSVASSVVTTPFMAAVLVLVYFDLRVRKEGFDLELLSQGVGIPGAVLPSRGSWLPPGAWGDQGAWGTPQAWGSPGAWATPS